MKPLLEKNGRSLSDIEVSISPYLKPLAAGALERYREFGVDQVILPVFARDRDSLLQALDELAERAATFINAS